LAVTKSVLPSSAHSSSFSTALLVLLPTPAGTRLIIASLGAGPCCVLCNIIFIGHVGRRIPFERDSNDRSRELRRPLKGHPRYLATGLAGLLRDLPNDSPHYGPVSGQWCTRGHGEVPIARANNSTRKDEALHGVSTVLCEKG
jgi:hypothetical protein